MAIAASGGAVTNPPGTVRDLLATRVAEAPDQLAIEDSEGRSLTYRQLWQAGGRLAGALAAAGVRHADPVAIAADRSIEMVVAMVGVLRLGAWYLLLDPSSPPARNRLLLAEAGARALVEASSATSNQPEWSLCDITPRLVLPFPTAAPPPEPYPEQAHDPDDIRYVAYTSGSTGHPKGVIASDRAVANFLTERELCPLAPGDRVASLSNPTSDATTLEIWKPLTAGATIVVLPQIAELDVADWRQLLRVRRITVMFMMAGLVELLSREDPSIFAPLDVLIFGGEPLNPQTLSRIFGAAPPRRLVLGYGPTETTVFSTYYDCTPQSAAGRDRIPLGFPLPNYDLFIVDDDQRPVAEGEVGELCVGGPSVASGYLARPELTAERFIHLTDATGVVYRTGDLVRQLPSGAVEFVARVDRQVKIRGYRVELEEVERGVLATGLVGTAVVEKVAGTNPHLVCFYVPRSEVTSADANELATQLSAELAERLPGYMIPARWVALAEVPFTSNGKIDRTRLLASL